MMISTKGRYALRVMLDLADHNTGDYIPLKDIAQRQEISVKYLENILASLSLSLIHILFFCDSCGAHFMRRVYRLLGGVVGQAYQDGKQRRCV